MVWFTADSSLSHGDKSFIPFLQKGVELLSLYELKDKVDEDFEVDVVVYAEHEEGTFMFGYNLKNKRFEVMKTCDRVSVGGLYSELETLETELDWKKIDAHMKVYEIKEVGITHFCREQTSVLWEAKK